jgi:hypothetical protein
MYLNVSMEISKCGDRGLLCVSENIVGAGISDGNLPVRLALHAFFELIYDRCGAERPAHLRAALKQAVDRVP